MCTTIFSNFHVLKETFLSNTNVRVMQSKIDLGGTDEVLVIQMLRTAFYSLIYVL